MKPLFLLESAVSGERNWHPVLASESEDRIKEWVKNERPDFKLDKNKQEWATDKADAYRLHLRIRTLHRI